MDPRRLDREALAHLIADAEFRLEQDARAEVGAQALEHAAAAPRVHGQADAGAHVEPAADPPAEACGGEMGVASRVERGEGVRRRRADEAERPDPTAAPAELKIGAVLAPAPGQRRVDVVSEDRKSVV